MQKRVELVDQLCFEFFQLFLSTDFCISLPKIKGILTICIAPLAVFFIEIAVSFTARGTVLKRCQLSYATPACSSA